MIRTISYNLPGYGFASCYLIGQAIDLMDMLEDAGVLEKMKNTCQLGTMKYIYILELIILDMSMCLLSLCLSVM